MRPRLGFELTLGADMYVQSVDAALGRFTPLASMRLRGATWDLNARFGVSVGSVDIVPIGANRESGKPFSIYFDSGGDGLSYKVGDGNLIYVKAWNINAYGKDRNRYAVRLGYGLPRVFVDSYAEMEGDSLIVTYSINVDSRTVLLVHQAIGEEHWHNFDKSVFNSAKEKNRVS